MKERTVVYMLYEVISFTRVVYIEHLDEPRKSIEGYNAKADRKAGDIARPPLLFKAQ